MCFPLKGPTKCRHVCRWGGAGRIVFCLALFRSGAGPDGLEERKQRDKVGVISDSSHRMLPPPAGGPHYMVCLLSGPAPEELIHVLQPGEGTPS